MLNTQNVYSRHLNLIAEVYINGGLFPGMVVGGVGNKNIIT